MISGKKDMSRKNLQLKRDTSSGEPRALSLEKAAGKVSNDLDKVIHERMRPRHHQRACRKPQAQFHRPQETARHHRRQHQRPRPKTRGSRLPNLHQIILRPYAANGIFDHKGRPQGVGAISRSYGSAYQSDEASVRVTRLRVKQRHIRPTQLHA